MSETDILAALTGTPSKKVAYRDFCKELVLFQPVSAIFSYSICKYLLQLNKLHA